MGSEKEKLYTIGQVSRLSGVPVKTIRHYSDIGALPPSGITEAGYRLYSEEDRRRLETIRTLRAAGFGLPTITRLLEEEANPSDAVRLQLEAVALQLRTLERQRKLLEAALENGSGDAMRLYPDRARALAVLTAREREAFLEKHFERGLEGIPVDSDIKEQFRRMMTTEFPEDLTDEQVSAWTELAQLAADESFLEGLRRQVGPFWEAVEGGFDLTEWREATDEAMREAVAAVREGRSPGGEREQRVVAGWISATARNMGRADDPDFPRWFLAHHDQTRDPRMERYWRLISTLKNVEYDPTLARAHDWLIEGLRHRLAGEDRRTG